MTTTIVVGPTIIDYCAETGETAIGGAGFHAAAVLATTPCPSRERARTVLVTSFAEPKEGILRKFYEKIQNTGAGIEILSPAENLPIINIYNSKGSSDLGIPSRCLGPAEPFDPMTVAGLKDVAAHNSLFMASGMRADHEKLLPFAAHLAARGTANHVNLTSRESLGCDILNQWSKAASVITVHASHIINVMGLAFVPYEFAHHSLLWGWPSDQGTRLVSVIKQDRECETFWRHGFDIGSRYLERDSETPIYGSRQTGEGSCHGRIDGACA